MATYVDAYASVYSSHSTSFKSTGGTPISPLQEKFTDVNDETINDISIPEVSKRLSRSWDISYTTEGISGICPTLGGIGTYTYNTRPINGCGLDYVDLAELSFSLDQSYVFGSKIWELTQTYPRNMEVTPVLFEFQQTYSFRYMEGEFNQTYSILAGGGAQNLYEMEFSQEYNIHTLAFSEDLLILVNDHRYNYGLTPIEGIWMGDPSKDMSHIHSIDMYDTGVFAHESTAYPVGRQTILERLSILTLYDGATGIGENLNLSYSSPTYLAGGGTSTSPSFTNNYPVTPYELFYAWRHSPGHNANMLHDWGSDDHPVMALGLVIGNYASNPALVEEWTTQLFIGYGIPGGTTMLLFELTQDWSIDHGNIKYFEQEYYFDAYFKARNQHEASYSMHASMQHEASYTSGLAVQHEAPIQYTISTQHEASYTVSTALVTQHEAFYDMPIRNVVVQHEAVYGLSMQVQHEADYGLSHNLVVQHEANYTDMFYVKAQHESLWDLDLINTLVVSHSAYWTIEGTAVYSGSTPQISAVIDGVSVPIMESIISSDEYGSLWLCKIILEDFAHYPKFIEGKQFTIDLGGDIYTFQYSTKSVQRGSPASVNLIVEGMSPAMVLQSPRATPITRDYNTSMLAQDLIEDILGQAVTWDFPVWYIPANTIVANDAIPLDLAKSIIEVAGGLLESNIDGSLLVRKKYRVNTNQYHLITPDQSYSDIDDNLSSSENYELRLGYNSFRVTDSDSDYGDILEFVAEDDSDTHGLLRAYPIPWRTTIEVKTTDAGLTYLGNPRWVVRSEESIIEFVEGVASLPYIAESITSVVWHSVSLGGITHTAYGSELTAGVTVNLGYGIATISYKVKCLEYDTIGTIGNPTQYVIADI